jgi:hypothetical protein
MARRRFPLWVPGALATGALAFGCAAPLWLCSVTQGMWPLLVTCVISAAVTARFTLMGRDGARGAAFALLAAIGSGLAYGGPMLFGPEAEFGRLLIAIGCFVYQALPAAIINVTAAIVADGFRRRARRPSDRCPVCGYDLKGAPTTACPECGA